jgi:hypothetical protein
MTVDARPVVALVYDDDAYVEAGGGAPGLMGRARLLTGELSYDHFLAECSQATAVDAPAMAAAVARLAGDEPLRRRMGEAGRRRAQDHFAWPRIIRAYERLWSEQEAERRSRAALRRGPSRWQGFDGQAAYPAPERTFAGYPTRRLEGRDRLAPAPGAGEALDNLLARPLTHHVAGRQAAGPEVLRSAIDRAPGSVADLDGVFAGASRSRRRPGDDRLDAQVRPAPYPGRRTPAGR